VFSAAEAYMIENGKVTYPSRRHPDRNGPDALTRVMMIGNDMSLDSGSALAARKVRACRWVWATTLRIDGLTVGARRDEGGDSVIR